MPTYDYRCKSCDTRFSKFYKSYVDYDNAAPYCPVCEGQSLVRVISGIAFRTSSRDYTAMSSSEMLSVFESGDSRAVGEMFDQVGGGDPHLGKEYHDATQKLLKGERIDKVEYDLQEQSKKNPPQSLDTSQE